MRQPTRAQLNLIAAATLVVLWVGMAFLGYHGVLACRNRAEMAQQDFFQKMEMLQGELRNAHAERAALASPLEQFSTLAVRQFPGAAVDARLGLLFQRINEITDAAAHAQGRRRLDAEAIERIRIRLQDAPGLDIEVGAAVDDPEALAFAKELKAMFEGVHGFTVRRLAEYLPRLDGIRGVAVYSRHELNEVLAGAIQQIFVEAGQPHAQWLSEDLLGAGSPDEPQPELKIIVGVR